MPSLYYVRSSFEASGGFTAPTAADVGYLFVEYFKMPIEDDTPRIRVAMISNGDGTYDYANTLILPDLTPSSGSLAEGVSNASWESDVKTAAPLSYVVGMTRAEFNQFVIDWGV